MLALVWLPTMTVGEMMNYRYVHVDTCIILAAGTSFTVIYTFPSRATEKVMFGVL